MNTQQMIEMAKEREGWEAYPSEKQKACVYDGKEGMEYGKAITGWGSVTQSWENANFIAHAPRTILALADEVARLQARCAELERNSLDGLHSPDESPPVAYANEENKRFRFESCEQVEAIVKMPLTKQMRFGRGNWEGRTEIEWQGGNSPFFGFRIEHEQVVGWRPLPAPQPSPDQP